MGLNHFADCDVQIGDLPEAEMKPPENVLFVCKLNPVTEVNMLLAPGVFSYYSHGSFCYSSQCVTCSLTRTEFGFSGR